MEPRRYEGAETAEIRRTVLLVISDEATRADLTAQLERGGFAVKTAVASANLADQVIATPPDLVLLGEMHGQLSGRQLALSLRARGHAFSVPVVAIVDDVSVPNIIRWLRVGVVDIWRVPWARPPAERAKRLILECQESLIQTAQIRPRLLAYARRAELSGTVIIYPGTPFEGRATFEGGELASAQFGGRVDKAALDQMLEFDEGPVRWDAAPTTQPLAPLAAPDGYRAKVLVVEDDAALQVLLKKRLESASYSVELASDGRQGLQQALRRQFDIIVADLGLPELDGWGLLRQLREDLVARESAVLVLSANDELVDTLKAARAGARAYLKKSVKARELLDTLALLAAPRARAWDALAAKREVNVELRNVGAVWFLRALAELDCSGKLELEDAMGRYEATLAAGQLVSAVSQTGSLRQTDTRALEALLASRADGRFVFSELEAPASAPWLYDMLDAACEASRAQAKQKLAAAIASPGKLFINEELAALFARVATVKELKVLEGVFRSPEDADALAKEVGLPRDEVDESLAELLRRGVLTTEP